MMISKFSLNTLVVHATEIRSLVKVQVGYKIGDSGRVSPTFATFRLMGCVVSFAEVIAKLKELGGTKINVTLPRLSDGIIQISLKPTYAAETLASVLEALDAEAKNAAQGRHADAAEAAQLMDSHDAKSRSRKAKTEAAPAVA